MLSERNNTLAEFLPEKCVHELFEAQALRAAKAAAVVYGEGELGYGELNRRANRLAHYLRRLGMKPGMRAGICVKRGFELIVGILAVWKAGAAYVPLDPGYPLERLRYMLADSAPSVLLTQGDLAERFREIGDGLPMIDLDLNPQPWAEEAETDPECAAIGLSSGHLAYVIYTSGSTGAPKGVMVTHRGVCNLASAQTQVFSIQAESRILQFSSSGFDASVFEIVMALCHGASLHLPESGAVVIGDALAQAMTNQRISHATLPPAVLAGLPESDGLDSVHTLIVAGDALGGELARRWARGRRLINAYGPTEATVWATMHECSAEESGSPPIGRPIANTWIYILDGNGEPVPAGVTGELYIGGAGVARGYLSRPGLTAERFVQDPYAAEPGARMYRTGDLGRRRSDGTIEFAGRNDYQVKVRGFRIELGEVEAVLEQHPGIKQAVAVVREENPGDKRLVAYVVSGAKRLEVSQIREWLAGKLPEYMRPSAFVLLKNLPLTSNGKIDRGALPAPARHRAALDRIYDAPATAAEEMLANIWAEVLHIDGAGSRDNFFHLGGDSLLAAQVSSRIHARSGVALPLRRFFENPVLADLARSLEAARRGTQEGEFPPLGAFPRGEEVPLGASQERVWFLHKLDPSSIAYHAQATLQISGPLQADVLERSLTALVHRHEILRTTFVEKDGWPIQVIHPPFAVSLPVVCLQHVEKDRLNALTARLIQAEITKPFDVGRLPLIRWILFSFSEHEHLLLHVEHHFVHDGWSFNVFLGELLELYTAFASGRPFPLAPCRLQFADFAIWQQHYRHSLAIQAQLSCWKNRLSGIPPVSELPTDYSRPRVQNFNGGLFRIALSPELSGRVRSFGHAEGASLFVVMMSAFFALAYHYTRQPDFSVGSSMANRHRPETEGLLGMLVNNVVLRAQLSAATNFRELVRQVRDLTFEAYENQDVPFQDVVQSLNVSRDLSVNPLFQTTFNFHNSPVTSPHIPELTLKLEEGIGNGGAKFDLGVIVIPSTEQRLRLNPEWDRDAIVMLWEYNTVLFDESTVQRMAGYYLRMLESITDFPQQKVAQVCLLTEAEKHQVLCEWNHTQADLPDLCVHELFEKQVRQTPHSVAIVQEEEELTYSELNLRANKVAHCLRTLGLRPGENAAILLGRSIGLVIAQLAILKCGAAYVPIDPAFPGERKTFMIADSEAKMMLCATDTELDVPHGINRVNLDTAMLSGGATDDPKISLRSDALAYIMYTSGSTGRPKGVMVPHQAIKRLVLNNGYVKFGAGDRVAFQSNPAFDAATMEVWAPLLHGGMVIVVSQETVLDPVLFGQALKRQPVDIAWFTVGLFNQYVESSRVDFSLLRCLIFGGDAPDPRVVARVLQRGGPRHLIQGYQPVPIAVAGELYIGGPGVAWGYLNRPELTAERFLPDMFAEMPGARIYKTGDLCRWNADGTIEFLGRDDCQVKVRGFRVELGEIEARLAEFPGIGQTAVIVREDSDGARRVLAYYTCAEAIGPDGTEPRVEELRAYLTATLPEYMVPAAYVRMQALPLTANGKLDRRALPRPDGKAYAVRDYEAPQGETETTLAAIFQQVLKLENIGRHDNFFELGGHSLLATKLVSRLRSLLGVEIAIRTIFELATVTSLAPTVEALILEDITKMPEAEAVHLANILEKQ